MTSDVRIRTEIDRLLKIEQAAIALLDYEITGAPDWLDWDAKFEALRDAVKGYAL